VSNRLVLATVFLVAILIGANFTMLKFALDHTTPMLLASMRTVVGGTFLIGFALLRGERLPRRFDDLRNIFVISLSITTVSSALLVFGVNRVPAGVASLMSSTMPLFTAVLSALLLGAAVSRVAGIGLGIGLAGTVILASPSLSGDTAAIGIISLAVSALAWAFGTVYMKWRDVGRGAGAICADCGRYRRNGVDGWPARPGPVCGDTGQCSDVCADGHHCFAGHADPSFCHRLSHSGLRCFLWLVDQGRGAWCG